MNRVVEIPGWDFEQLKSQTYDAWNRELSCVEVQSDDVEAICQFYTALYHSFLYPNIVSDADGTYKGRQVAWGVCMVIFLRGILSAPCIHCFLF